LYIIGKLFTVRLPRHLYQIRNKGRPLFWAMQKEFVIEPLYLCNIILTIIDFNPLKLDEMHFCKVIRRFSSLFVSIILP